jgi:glycosyltransferase involved in cell wall biosynthesis
MGDIFSTPGHIGLALVQAMYWSKPVVVLNRTHAPEIIYLHQGENGFIVNTPMELKQTVLQLCHDKSLYERFSENARKTYEDEMQISVMFKGFMEAIRFVMN